MELSTELIKRALALCEYRMEDMDEFEPDGGGYEYELVFSYPKFYAYLLSEEFIEKYGRRYTDYPYWMNTNNTVAYDFGKAIYEHQKGNSEPLESLLTKIK